MTRLLVGGETERRGGSWCATDVSFSSPVDIRATWAEGGESATVELTREQPVALIGDPTFSNATAAAMTQSDCSASAAGRNAPSALGLLLLVLAHRRRGQGLYTPAPHGQRSQEQGGHPPHREQAGAASLPHR